MVSERDCVTCGCGLYPNEGPRCTQCENAYEDGYAEGVKATLSKMRELNGDEDDDWDSCVDARVDEAERALSVTPREAEEGKGS